MALQIAKDRVVSLAYRILDDAGNVLDERTPEQQYGYLHGHGQVIAPVERRLEGKTTGFRDEILVLPREAYGEYQPDLVIDLERQRFPANIDLRVGLKFSTKGPDGQSLTVRVIEFDEQVVTVDGNHPLTGLQLVFDLRVLAVREAQPEEIRQGRVGALAGSSGVNATGGDEDDPLSTPVH